MKKHVCIIGLIAVLFIVGQSFAVNIALNKPATASHELDTTFQGSVYGLAGCAVDGDPISAWNAGGAASIANPEWLLVDLENVYNVKTITLTGVVFDDGWSGRDEYYNLYSSLNNQDWSKIGNGRLVSLYDPTDTYNFNQDISMRYIKFEVVGGSNWAHLSELEVVPEPATLSLLALGGMILRKRK